MKKIIEISLNSTKLSGEVDTGCPVTLIGINQVNTNNIKIVPSKKTLYSVNNDEIKLAVTFEAKLSGNGKSGIITVYVVVYGQALPFGLRATDTYTATARYIYILNKAVVRLSSTN